MPHLDNLNGVDPNLAAAVDQVRQEIEAAYPTVSLKVVSGYRSPQAQEALRARWDSGQRAGLVVRPAISSAHSRGLAVDLAFTVAGVPIPVALTPKQAFQWLAGELSRYGVTWGGRFKQPDVNHFEVWRP